MAEIRRGRVARLPGANWEAKFPEFAMDDGRAVGEIRSPETGPLGSAAGQAKTWHWVPAFSVSHLHSFALDDSRKLLLIKDDNGRYIYNPPNLPPSRIFVRFRAKGKNPMVGYVYSSRNHTLMEHIFNRMRAAPNIKNKGPGVVVKRELEMNPEVSYYQSNALVEDWG